MLREALQESMTLGPLLTQAQSEANAQHTIQHRPRLWEAAIKVEKYRTVEKGSDKAHLILSVAMGKRRVQGLGMKMQCYPWPKEFPEKICGTVHEAEIYAKGTSRDFVVRLVRRGIPWQETGRRYDLAELYFRVRPNPIPLVERMDETPDWNTASPDLLCMLMGCVEEATVEAGDMVINFDRLRFGRHVVKVGAHLRGWKTAD